MIFFFPEFPKQQSQLSFLYIEIHTQLRWTESIPHVVTVETIDEDIASEIQEVYSWSCHRHGCSSADPVSEQQPPNRKKNLERGGSRAYSGPDNIEKKARDSEMAWKILPKALLPAQFSISLPLFRRCNAVLHGVIRRARDKKRRRDFQIAFLVGFPARDCNCLALPIHTGSVHHSVYIFRHDYACTVHLNTKHL